VIVTVTLATSDNTQNDNEGPSWPKHKFQRCGDEHDGKTFIPESSTRHSWTNSICKFSSPYSRDALLPHNSNILSPWSRPWRPHIGFHPLKKLFLGVLRVRVKISLRPESVSAAYRWLPVLIMSPSQVKIRDPVTNTPSDSCPLLLLEDTEARTAKERRNSELRIHTAASHLLSSSCVHFSGSV
jgi:hypothetical protein